MVEAQQKNDPIDRLPEKVRSLAEHLKDSVCMRCLWLHLGQVNSVYGYRELESEEFVCEICLGLL
jgi:hypothetical protein